MRRRISPLQALGSTALLTLAAAVCILYSKLVPGTGDEQAVSSGSEDPPAADGTADYSDPNAPKSIGCADIVSFRCEISLLSVTLPENSSLTGPRYAFSARRDGDSVLCTLSSDSGSEEFTRKSSFLTELQGIVTRFDLAQYNGRHRETQGLPDDFGAHLRVSYTSGESISADDNRDMFLPLDAAEALAELFSGEQEMDPAAWRSISMEEAAAMMAEEGVLIVDVRRQDEYAAGHIPGAICVPNEDIQAETFAGLPDREQTLLIYCRSGRRSKEAAGKLAELGYRRVLEFGGILDWPGEVVTEEADNGTT